MVDLHDGPAGIRCTVLVCVYGQPNRKNRRGVSQSVSTLCDVIPEKQHLTSSPRYNAKAKRYPFKQEEIGFVKFNLTAGERFLFLLPFSSVIAC